MKCSNCGQEMADGVQYCPYCGAKNELEEKQSTENKEFEMLMLAKAEETMHSAHSLGLAAITLGVCAVVLRFVFDLFSIMSIPALVCGIIGLSKYNSAKATGIRRNNVLTMNVIGVVLGAIAIIMNIVSSLNAFNDIYNQMF